MDPPDPDYILRGFDGAVTSLTFLPSSNGDGSAYLVAGTQTGSLSLWSVRTRRVLHSMKSIHASPVLSITVLGDGSELLSQGREGVVIQWKLLTTDNWIKVGTYACGDLGFAPVAVFSTHGKLMLAASTGDQSRIAVVAVETGQMVTILKPRQSVGMVMDIKGAGQDQVIAGYEDGSIMVWDVRFPDCEKTAARLHSEPISGFDYCERTQRGVSATVTGSVVSWSGADLKQTASANIKGGATCVRGRPDGKLFAVGGCDSRIYLYSGTTKLLPLAVVHAHSQSVQSLAFNGADQTLAAGSRDKTVSIWSMYKDS